MPTDLSQIKKGDKVTLKTTNRKTYAINVKEIVNGKITGKRGIHKRGIHSVMARLSNLEYGVNMYPVQINDDLKVYTIKGEIFEIEVESLNASNRSRTASAPRMLAMWLARRHTAAGLHEISTFFGRRSHSSAVTASNTVEGWLSECTKMKIN